MTKLDAQSGILTKDHRSSYVSVQCEEFRLKLYLMQFITSNTYKVVARKNPCL